MSSLHTTANFESDGLVTLKAPGLATPGLHKVMLVLEDDATESLGAMTLSSASFARVWDNKEDEIYDSL